MVRKCEYNISDEASAILESYVLDLERNPRGKRVGKIDFADPARAINRSAILNVLPEGMSEEDFVGIMSLSLLTECATDSYAAIFCESGRAYAAPWLSGFTERIWVPDEYEHADPFKLPLMTFGYSEEELNRNIKDTQEKIYEHSAGSTPVQLTVFGELQEDLTEGWYNLSSPLVAPVAPIMAQDIQRVRKRETLHKAWYRDMTSIQIADNPNLIHSVVDTIAGFDLPGNKLVKDLEDQAFRWIQKMGGDFRQIERRIVRLVADSINRDPKLIGIGSVELAIQTTEGTTSLLAKLLKAAGKAPVLGEKINLLIGQAVQEREDMKPQTDEEKKFWDNTAGIRSFIVGQMDRTMRPLFYP